MFSWNKELNKNVLLIIRVVNKDLKRVLYLLWFGSQQQPKGVFAALRFNKNPKGLFVCCRLKKITHKGAFVSADGSTRHPKECLLDWLCIGSGL